VRVTRGAVVGLAGLVLALSGCGLLSPPTTATTSGQNAAASPAASSQASAPPYNVTGLLHPATGKYFGIEADGAPDSLAPVQAFAANTGRKPDLIGQYVAWGKPFDAQAVSNAWSYGALYYMAWEPFGVSVQSIAAGHSDGYLTRFAKAVRSLNLPVAISFGHEMNGNWYPWGTSQTTAAQFVAAWRHIHDLFARAGATNVIWVWNPNIINPVPQVPLRPFWPGRAYVSWVGLTGYFATTGAQTFATLYQPTMTEIRHFTGKPFIIAETAIETGPAAASCAKQLVDTVTQHPNVLGFVWFDYDKQGVDWRVETRPVVRAAVAGDIAGLTLVNPRK
jgi:mannan endo-1,4-beta-mannosidase